MANECRTLYITVRKRQASFCGHEMRRGVLKHIVTVGKIKGKRGRGRPTEMTLGGRRRRCGEI